MAKHKITVNTAAYRRTHGTYPWNTQGHGNSMWAFLLDADEKVTVKYGTYKTAVQWAKAQATTTVKVLP